MIQLAMLLLALHATRAALAQQLPVAPDGLVRSPLPGMPIEVLIRLRVAPTRLLESRGVCHFSATWNSPDHAQQQRVQAELALPVVSGSQWRRLTPDRHVEDLALLLTLARLKHQYARCLDAMDVGKARELLAAASRLLEEAPNFPHVQQEREGLAELQRDLEEGRLYSSSKLAKYRAYLRRGSKPIT